MSESATTPKEAALGAHAQDVATFDPFDALPSGTFSIEASAGTGKTYTLAGLATRYLAEGRVTAPEILMVTFTRAATGELRSRVRERVAEAARHLGNQLSGLDTRDHDPFLRWLGSPQAPGGSLQSRFDRLEAALSEFDAATITTIHGFAAQVLGALGVGSGVAGELRFVEDTDQRLVEACSDLLVAASVDPTISAELPSWAKLTKNVKSVLNSPDVIVTPAEHDPDAPQEAVLLALLVRRVRDLMRSRRRDSGTQSFDDLLLRLREALDAPGTGAAATTVLRKRFAVALIDEFQDTDPVQWQIFRTLFAPGSDGGAGPAGVAADTALVLVGDPKQAIYSFRGADVSTYVSAVETTPDVEKRTLRVNWRSDGPVVDATATLFEGVSFGEAIDFSPVAVADHHEKQRLHRKGTGSPTSGQPMPGIDIRCAVSAGLLGDKGTITSPRANQAITADLVSHTVDMLESCVLLDAGSGSPGDSVRPLEPKDIAVLVRSNASAESVQAALLEAGVPAVLARGASVTESRAAEQLRWLLEALVLPSDQRRARTFATSWFGGMNAQWVADATESDIGRLQELLTSWSAVLNTHGVVDFVRAVWEQTGVVQRLLAEPDGDRCVTDLEHLGELLRMSVGDGAVSAAGLLAALAGLRQGVEVQVDTDRDTDVTSRRVESDAEAVQIMTVWVAKGLEFPVVLCPNMWSRASGSVDYHDPETGHRVFDVQPPGEARKRLPDEVALAEAERSSEELRLLYVALTRARHHTAIWWTNCASAHSSSLAKVLFARSPEGAVSAELFEKASLKAELPSHEDTVTRLDALVHSSRGAISVCDIGDPTDSGSRWVDPSLGIELPKLSAAEFTRGGNKRLRRSRSRWSFTAVVSRDRTKGDPYDLTIDDEGAQDEQRPPDVGHPEVPGLSQETPAHGEADLASGYNSAEGGGDSVASESPLAWLPAGAAFGTLAHEVLERVDFAAADLRAEIAEAVDEQRRWRSLSLRPLHDQRPHGDPDAERAGADLLVDGLRAAIETPLVALGGPTATTPVRLADIARRDRLDEMEFELNLGAAPSSAGHTGRVATDRDVGLLLTRYLDTDDPFAPWASRLADGIFGVDLDGHLTGSIDAVLRLGSSPKDPSSDRFVVVDYKTNRLHDHGVAPRTGDYAAPAMHRSMMEHHYPLQAILYSVALHRYLRWRLPGYDPAVNLGGVAYLFLRGMTGSRSRPGADPPDEPESSVEGVCTWMPGAELISELSDLLNGRHPLLEARS